MLIRTIGWYLLIGWIVEGIIFAYAWHFDRDTYDELIRIYRNCFDTLGKINPVWVLIGILCFDVVWPNTLYHFLRGRFRSITSKLNDKQP